MPPKTKTRRTAPRTRANSRERKGKKAPGRQAGAGATPKAPRIIADSLFTVTFRDKPGIEVIEKAGGRHRRAHYEQVDDYRQMYRDLLLIVQHGLKVLKGENTNFDPLASGLGIGTALHYVVKSFEANILPKDWEYNIDRDDHGYFFTIYQTCEFPGFWHAFYVKPVIRKLAFENKPLHDLFLSCINLFREHIQIGAWWNSGSDYTMYNMEEQLEHWDDNYEEGYEEEDKERDYVKTAICLDDYTAGDAHLYVELIRRAVKKSPAKILAELKRFNQKSRIVKWMTSCCQLMQSPANTEWFEYREYEFDEDGLQFYAQISIVWDDDEYAGAELALLDSQAQGFGINAPVLHHQIGLGLTAGQLEKLNEYLKWPAQLHSLWVQYDAMLNSLRYAKRKN